MIPFRIFKAATPAKDMAVWLQNRQIKATYHEAKPVLDTLYIGSVHTTDYIVSIAAEEFAQAKKLLVTYYQHQLNNIPKDYYLFDFTDSELINILKKPDEWGDLDYALAQELLEQRGLTITDAQLQEMHSQRLEQLKQTSNEAKAFIPLGFVLCFIGGIVGSLFGWYLAYTHKTLPDGTVIPLYAEQERNKGKTMIWLGIAITILVAALYFIQSFQTV